MPIIEALFVDRDGTLIEDKNYLSDPNGVCLLPSVASALQKISAQGIHVFVVTNQSGIGRGYFNVEDFHACQEELIRQLKTHDVTITDSAYCPHDPNDTKMCDCRKPNIGMWEQLAQKYGLDAQKCAMIGDKIDDVAFGVNAGFAYSALVGTGNGFAVATKLGLHFADTAQEVDCACLKQKESKTTCILAKDFASFTEYLLERSW